MSLWKPGVPYPVHGRVLVEIQRPRSLHRKAVIQLNTKRNQHNQSSKHQFIGKQKHQRTQASLRKSYLFVWWAEHMNNCRPLDKPVQLGVWATTLAITLAEPSNLSDRLVYGYSSLVTYRNDWHSCSGVVDLGTGVEVLLYLPCYWQLVIILT